MSCYYFFINQLFFKNMRFKSFIFSFLCLAIGAQQLHAQANLSVQGTIQKSFGAAVDDGDYSLTFKLYTAETGGVPVWSETQDAVSIIGGVYSVVLGTVEPLTAAFDQPYYLGVTVDGGAELVPRARLTSSPYALSLIGQDNIFPSTGAVGTGTASPAAGYQLHVANVTGEGKLLVEGTDAAKIDLKKAGNTLGIAFDGSVLGVSGTINTTGDLVASGTASVSGNGTFGLKLAAGQTSVDANHVFKVNGSSHLNGTTWVGGPIEAQGNQSSSYPQNTVLVITTVPGTFPVLPIVGINNVGANTQPYSLYAHNGIRTPHVVVPSDRRIKKDFRISDRIADLETLKKIRVTDYRHIDHYAKGTAFTKGVVAQEVAEVFPEAISRSSDFLPSVLAAPVMAKFDNGVMVLTMPKDHELIPGDEVKLIVDDQQRTITVLDTPSPTSFRATWEDATPYKLFVYGKKVDDFNTVDYDRLFMLNISATQELVQQVEQLKAENEALRLQNNKLQGQNDGLRTDINNIESRLSKIENLATGTVQK